MSWLAIVGGVVAVVVLLLVGERVSGEAVRWLRQRTQLRVARRSDALFAGLCRNLGLRHEGAIAHGAVEAHPVRVELRRTDDAEGWVVVVSVHDLPDDLAVEPRQGRKRGEVGTGDADFDRVATVVCDDALAVGRLTAAVREWLGPPLRRDWVWLRDGVLVARVPDGELTPERLRRWVDGLVFCANELKGDASPELRTLALTQQDPDRSVRRHAVRRLVLGRYPSAEAALVVAPGHGPEWAVLRAAHTGDHAALAEALANPTLPLEVRSDAALALVRAPERELTAALSALWQTAPDPMWGWMLRALRTNEVRAGWRGAVDLLRRRPGRSNLEFLRAQREAVGLLGEIGGPPDVEEALVEALATPRLRRPAIAALARVGTVRAVEPLLPLADGGLLFSGVRTEAAKAIAAIQGRVGQVDRGGLALVGDVGGGDLSVARGVGALSEPKDR